MECQTCDALLAEYKQRIGLFTNAERRLRGTSGDDFRPVLIELKRLKQPCRDADNALIAHLRQDHSNFTHEPAS